LHQTIQGTAKLVASNSEAIINNGLQSLVWLKDSPRHLKEEVKGSIQFFVFNFCKSGSKRRDKYSPTTWHSSVFGCRIDSWGVVMGRPGVLDAFVGLSDSATVSVSIFAIQGDSESKNGR
jgi:hypothetical protein